MGQIPKVCEYLPEAYKLLDEAREKDKTLKLNESKSLDALIGAGADVVMLNKKTGSGFKSVVKFCLCNFELNSYHEYIPHVD